MSYMDFLWDTNTEVIEGNKRIIYSREFRVAIKGSFQNECGFR